jgi:hypothetical protein
LPEISVRDIDDSAEYASGDIDITALEVSGSSISLEDQTIDTTGTGTVTDNINTEYEVNNGKEKGIILDTSEPSDTTTKTNNEDKILVVTNVEQTDNNNKDIDIVPVKSCSGNDVPIDSDTKKIDNVNTNEVLEENTRLKLQINELMLRIQQLENEKISKSQQYDINENQIVSIGEELDSKRISKTLSPKGT